jgi:ribosomal protein RSM22 (predicted rRNA methylase)
MDADLPPELRAALDRLTRGQSRNAAAQRAQAISRLYRSGTGSSGAIQTPADALAYAFTRLPATYAAITAVLAALREAAPDSAPRTLIDAGAGPGTAAWAAAQQMTSIEDIRLIDDNRHLREVALALLESSEAPALCGATYVQADLVASLSRAAPADLVIASYVIGELAPDLSTRTADALWSAAGGVLVVIEPGTPAGFSRIRALRTHLLAQGAHVLAPCPHDGACPIVDPDWCHFTQRLNRSRDHRRVKGASLSFEDEKFSYVALARTAPSRIDARVLAHPRATKGTIAAKLCTAEGIETELTARRDREAYRRRNRWRWGDAVSRSEPDG